MTQDELRRIWVLGAKESPGNGPARILAAMERGEHVEFSHAFFDCGRQIGVAARLESEMLTSAIRFAGIPR